MIMPTITIGRSEKRINSTSRVMSAGGTALSCRLKEPCSMQAPVFQVKGLTKGTLYNFAKFENNYYWVDDVVYLTNDIQEVHCHLDPIATFRDAIKDTNGMVIYGAKANWNKFVDDGRIQPEIFAASTNSGDDMFGLKPSTQGCIAMTFTQTSSLNFLTKNELVTGCGIHTALMSISSFKTCIGDLNNFDISSTTAAWELMQAFARAFSSGSLLDNILRVIWLPFDLDDLIAKLNAGERYGMIIGGVGTDNTVWYEIDQASIYAHDGSFTIDWDSLTGGLQSLRHDRFISLQICNCGGYMSVPVDRFVNAQDTLYYRCSFSVADGSWSFKVSSSSLMRDTLASNSGQVGVNMMGTIYAGPTPSNVLSDAGAKFVTAAVGLGVGSIAAGVISAGGVGAAASEASAAASAYGKGQLSLSSLANTSIGTAPSLKQLGTINVGTGIVGIIPQNSAYAHCASGSFNGGATGLFLNGGSPGYVYYQAECWKPLFIHQGGSEAYESYCNEYGYPVNRYMRIGDNTGFVMCASANVSHISGASEANKATINNFLNNGIYIEE